MSVQRNKLNHVTTSLAQLIDMALKVKELLLFMVVLVVALLNVWLANKLNPLEQNLSVTAVEINDIQRQADLDRQTYLQSINDLKGDIKLLQQELIQQNSRGK